MEPSDQHPLPAVQKVSLKLARNRRRVRKKGVTEGEHERASREHGEHWESTSEHRGSMGEHRGSIREHGGSILTEQALAGEQSGET